MSEYDWGTSKWGNSYEHLPSLEGTQYTQIIRNYSRSLTTSQLEEITYNGYGNEFYENVNRVEHTTNT